MDQNEQAELFYDSGAKWSRNAYMRWEDIEPENTNPNSYHWESVDEAGLMAAVVDGRQTIANILMTPEWAQKYPGHACGPIAQESFADFAEFMHAVVARYSLPPYNVTYWEIGNEPDIDWNLVDGNSQYGCWGEHDDPYYGGGYYAEMLKVVYPEIKAADPNAKLIVGGLVLDCDPLNPPETAPNSGEYRDCTSAKFLEGILKAGGGDYFDGVSYHAYDYYYGEEGIYGNDGWHSASNTSGPVLLAKTNYLKSLLGEYDYASKELLNTELAVLCGRDGKEDYCQGEAFPNTKANYVAQANAAALAMGLKANIWYSLTGWRGSGLVDDDLNPSPAYSAYQFAATRFDEAEYIGEISDYPGLMGYKFKSGDKNIWILWSLDGDSHIVEIPEEPAAVFDVIGTVIPKQEPGTTQINVAAEPIYIEFTP